MKYLKITTGIMFIALFFIISIFSSCKKDKDSNSSSPAPNKTGTFTDTRDGHVYNWVEIGNQVWMTENLAYMPRLANVWAYNNDENNVQVYGYLYSWETALTIAPDGWHLPGQAEWETLVNSLGGTEAAYNKLLEKGNTHWGTPNEANNESGFTALPSGYFDQRDNTFNSMGSLTMFHSTTEYPGNTSSAMGLILNQNFKEAGIEGRPKDLALPVRCVKN